jgi:aarF domain-containing kinase
MTVAQGVRLRRYAVRRRGGHEVLFERLSSGLYVGLRLVQLQAIFVPLGVLSPMLLAGRHGRRLWYQLAVWALRLGGPTFVKLGQWAGTRPDLLPPELCRALGELHSQAPEHGMAWTRLAFRQAFGATLDEAFAHVDAAPVGSGSVAQVYRARSRTGRLVALKVLHPGVHAQVALDLQLLGLVAGLAHRLPPLAWLQLPAEMAYFRQAMEQQLDLRFEAYTLARFRRNFARSGLAAFPEPLAAARDVLVESFEQGAPIALFTQARPGEPHWARMQRDLAQKGLQAFLQMLLWDNFVHADLHPGNMLVAFPDGPPVQSPEEALAAYAAGRRPALVFLDTGLVTELARQDFANFTDLFRALVFRADGRLAGRLLIERAPGDAPTRVIDADAFCDSLHRLVRPVFAAGGPTGRLTLTDLAISPLLLQTFDLVRAHHVHLQGAYTNLVMSLVCVEGLGRQLAPQLGLRPLLLSAGLQYLATSLAKTVTETVEPFL